MTTEAPATPPVAPPMSAQDALYPAQAPAPEAPVTPPVTPPVDAPVGPPVDPATPLVDAPAPDAPPPEPEPPVDPLTLVPPDAASYSFTPPEGFRVNEEALGKFKDLALSKSMTQADFNAAMEIHTELLKQQVEVTQTAQLKAFQDTQADWLRQVNEMPEFQGQRREGTERAIGKLLDEYGSPEVRELFSITGAGNNPAMVKMFAKLAAALGEGAPTTPGTPPAAARKVQTLTDVFYPPKES